MPSSLPTPLLLPYGGIAPTVKGPMAGHGEQCAVLGRVTLGGAAFLGPFAVLRGDGHSIDVGTRFHLGAHSTVHISHELYGTTIGDGVSIGRNTVVHACTVEDGCVVQDDACILDGAVVGRGSVVARGSVVFPKAELPAGQWCEGVPAVPVRPVGAEELAALHTEVRTGASATAATGSATRLRPGADVAGYVAATVVGDGGLHMGDESSLWFGCRVEAAGHEVSIAAGANVQDNSLLRCTTRGIEVGADTTVGHNVTLHDCTVGDRVLVGMGSVLSPGTRIMDEVLLAAGSTTQPGQVLERGWLWGGRPAKQIAPVGDKRMQVIVRSAAIYREYMREFARVQAEAQAPSKHGAM